MRADRSTSLGQQGELEVAAELAAFGWGPVRTELGSDLGTDIYAQIRDSDTNDLGLLLSFQVKTGETFFRRATSIGELGRGWWHEERDYEHVESWVGHSLPHILVLRNARARLSYWVHVNSDSVVSMDVGTKIFVPESQILDEESRLKLTRIASAQRPRSSLEGTVWRGASGVRYTPAAALRTALLCPRLVAPHGNDGAIPVTAEQVAALSVQGRVVEVGRHLSKRTTKPRSVPEMQSDKRFLWQLASAIYDSAHKLTFSFPIELAEKATSRHAKVAVAVLRVTVLIGQDCLDEAEATIDRALPKSSGVDRSWLLVQKARCASILGDRGRTRSLCDEAQLNASFFADDVTASALSGVSASLSFRAAQTYSPESIESVVSQEDTAVSWWRSQLASTGLARWAEARFASEMKSESVTIGKSDIALLRLRGAAWTADFLGDDSAWRASAALYARYLSRDKSTSTLAVALELFRTCGDKKSTKLLARMLWREGPVSALIEVASNFRAWAWTDDRFAANLSVIDEAADVMVLEDRIDLVDLLCNMVSDPESVGALTVIDRADLLRALESVTLVSKEEIIQRKVASELLSHLASVDAVDDLTAMAIGSLATALEASKLSDSLAAELAAACAQVIHAQVTADVLSMLSANSSVAEQVKPLLVERARDGDLHALRRTTRDDFKETVSSDDVGRLVDQQVAEIEVVRAQARQDEHGSYPGESPAARTLALLSVDYPDQARWRTVVEFIRDEKLPKELKRDVCTALATVVEGIPDEYKAELSQAAEELDGHALEFGLFGRLAGGHIQLMAALGVVSDEVIASKLSRLLSGRERERMDAAATASYWEHAASIGFLLTLAVDADARVRATAVNALFHRGDDGLNLSAIRAKALAEDCGVSVPMQILQSWVQGSVKPVLPGGIVNALRSHSSASVRMNFAKLDYDAESTVRTKGAD